ncbi:MAG: hypothetical protein EBR82_04355 [Caulobacteraceae bacterium]|nr:hypothetical protein [Caulobacteraceae bacterium]
MTDGRCPVCFLPDGLSSNDRYQEICPCCGTQFGLDDARVNHADLRQKWIAAGHPWWSRSTLPPDGWDAEAQLNSQLPETP